MSSCGRYPLAHKTWNIYSLTFYRRSLLASVLIISGMSVGGGARSLPWGSSNVATVLKTDPPGNTAHMPLWVCMCVWDAQVCAWVEGLSSRLCPRPGNSRCLRGRLLCSFSYYLCIFLIFLQLPYASYAKTTRKLFLFVLPNFPFGFDDEFTSL